MTLEEILSVRPRPASRGPTSFPTFERTVLPSGMQVLVGGDARDGRSCRRTSSSAAGRATNLPSIAGATVLMRRGR